MKIFIKYNLFGLLFAFSLLAFLSNGTAQEQKKYGMQSLKSNPIEKGEDSKKLDEIEEETELPKDKLLPLTIKESLVKIDDLEKWGHLDEAALANTDKEVSRLIYIIESDRGAVPPQGLFLAAKALADKNLMEQAALYYLAGQLRLAFDMQRWPSVQNKDDIKRKSEDNKKSSDQSAPNLDKPPRIDNPHAGIKNLSDMVGSPIISWLVKNPARMNAVLAKVRIWDASASYAYLPDYDLTEPIEFEKWERTLKRVREKYFEHMSSLTKAMERVKR
jgi:hypothetical protein